MISRFTNKDPAKRIEERENKSPLSLSLCFIFFFFIFAAFFPFLLNKLNLSLQIYFLLSKLFSLKAKHENQEMQTLETTIFSSL